MAIRRHNRMWPGNRLPWKKLEVAVYRMQKGIFQASQRGVSYLYASNLGHIPEQLAWATAKRGIAAHTVKAAYSSQECHRCHYVDRANRPDQKTFRCIVCGYEDHADHNASLNLADRWEDRGLAACQNKAEVKALLLKRHAAWKIQKRAFVVGPAVQLSLWDQPRD